jgi:hypothetical protein
METFELLLPRTDLDIEIAKGRAGAAYSGGSGRSFQRNLGADSGGPGHAIGARRRVWIRIGAKRRVSGLGDWLSLVCEHPLLLSGRRPAEGQHVGVVDHAVADGVGHRRVGELLVPALGRYPLRGNDEGFVFRGDGRSHFRSLRDLKCALGCRLQQPRTVARLHTRRKTKPSSLPRSEATANTQAAFGLAPAPGQAQFHHGRSRQSARYSGTFDRGARWSDDFGRGGSGASLGAGT